MIRQYYCNCYEIYESKYMKATAADSICVCLCETNLKIPFMVTLYWPFSNHAQLMYRVTFPIAIDLPCN